VQKSDVYKNLLLDLTEQLERMAEEEDMPLLREFTVKENESYSVMADKVACLIQNATIESFGLTDADLEQDMSEKVSPEQLRIAELIGELLEELDLDCETVDQMKQLYLVLDLSKVPELSSKYASVCN
jgi:hypothetical protein